MATPDGSNPSRREEEEHRLSQYDCPENVLRGFSGVLLSDQIEDCVRKFRMIDPFNRNGLKPAAYELRIGGEYALRGEIRQLQDRLGANFFVLEPFDVAVIKIHERLNLPRNIIARWNIKVSLAYKGLVWVGGPQVDPGWVGHLSCPIYNLSDRAVRLDLYQEIAVMDFVLTTPFDRNSSKHYPRPPKRVLFEDYGPQELQSALITHASRRIDQMESRLGRIDVFEGRLTTFTSVTFTVIGILVAALAIFVSSGAGNRQTQSIWIYASTGLSIGALVIALFAFYRDSRVPRAKRNAMITRFVMMGGAFLVGVLVTLIAAALVAPR
jgi:deoxycytidine triphosphate deaminase